MRRARGGSRSPEVPAPRHVVVVEEGDDEREHELERGCDDPDRYGAALGVAHERRAERPDERARRSRTAKEIEECIARGPSRAGRRRGAPSRARSPARSWRTKPIWSLRSPSALRRTRTATPVDRAVDDHGVDDVVAEVRRAR